MSAGNLTLKQNLFIREFLVDLNAIQVAIKVAARIDQILKEHVERTEVGVV